MARLTKRRVDSAMYDPDGPAWQWLADDEAPGFGLRLYDSGRKAFAVRYRTRDGRQRYLTLGTYPTLTVQQARTRAQREIVNVLEGADPVHERRRERTAAHTVDGLMTAWLEDHAKAHRKRWEEDARRIDARIRPPLGSLVLHDLTPERIAAYHRSVGAEARVEANRCVETIRAAWRWAEREGRVPEGLSDPTRRVKRFRELSRDRWLRRHEVARLIEATDKEEDPYVRAAVRLLLLTGLRKNELLSARWSNVELDRGEIRLPDTKSGQAQTRPLPSRAVQILRDLPREDSDWVFPSPVDRRKHRRDLKRSWERIRDTAGLEDVTLHDLRRTAGSYMAQAGVPLQVIQHVLGHSHPGVTRLYARLGRQDERNALETVAGELSGVPGFNGKGPGSDSRVDLRNRLEALLDGGSDAEALAARLRTFAGELEG